MIGRVHYDGGAFTLEDDGTLTGDVPPLVPDRLAEYREDYSPADGAWGVGFLTRLAKVLGGRPEIEPKSPPHEGQVIY